MGACYSGEDGDDDNDNDDIDNDNNNDNDSDNDDEEEENFPEGGGSQGLGRPRVVINIGHRLR